MSTYLSEDVLKVIERLADVILPSSVSFVDVTEYLGGYDKEKAIKHVLKLAKENPLFTKIKLGIVLTELKELNDKGLL